MFGPSEVKLSMQMKQLIDTCSIMGVTNSVERKEIFGKDRETSPRCHLLHLQQKISFIISATYTGCFKGSTVFKVLSRERVVYRL